MSWNLRLEPDGERVKCAGLGCRVLESCGGPEPTAGKNEGDVPKRSQPGSSSHSSSSCLETESTQALRSSAGMSSAGNEVGTFLAREAEKLRKSWMLNRPRETKKRMPRMTRDQKSRPEMAGAAALFGGAASPSGSQPSLPDQHRAHPGDVARLVLHDLEEVAVEDDPLGHVRSQGKALGRLPRRRTSRVLCVASGVMIHAS